MMSSHTHIYMLCPALAPHTCPCTFPHAYKILPSHMHYHEHMPSCTMLFIHSPITHTFQYQTTEELTSQKHTSLLHFDLTRMHHTTLGSLNTLGLPLPHRWSLQMFAWLLYNHGIPRDKQLSHIERFQEHFM